MQKAECRNAEWILPSGMQHEANPPHILFLRVGAALAAARRSRNRATPKGRPYELYFLILLFRIVIRRN